MRRIGLFLWLWMGLLWHGAYAGSYALTDGTRVSGDPINYDLTGVMLKSGADTYSERIAWGKFTDEALRQLRDDTRNPQYKAIVAPMILNAAPVEKPRLPDITVKAVETPPRPSGPPSALAIFTSPLGWVMLLILYGTNLFAAYEVALFRNQPLATVCGLAAIPFLGVASPIMFLALPARPCTEDESAAAAGGEANAASYTLPPVASATAACRAAPAVPGSLDPSAGAPAAEELPAPVVFQRGDYLFNRRFFETKLAGFFRVVLGEADKDLRVCIHSSRGDFVGKRITRVTPSELYLQVFKDSATADEMIPFVEILEVQIRHKDLT